MTRQRLATLLVLTTALVALAPISVSRAQQPLPATVIQAQSLDAAAQKSIADYVAEPLKKLESEDFKDLKSARDKLLDPLKDSGISVAFRQEYTKDTITRLTEVAANKNDLNAVNALRILGELGTSDALDVLEKQIADKRISIRYAAALGIERNLKTLNANSGLAITPQRAADAVKKLGDLLAAETEPEIANATTRAITGLFQFDRQGFASVRESAMTALANGIHARAMAFPAKPSNSNLDVLVYACTQARNALAQANPQLRLAQNARLQVAEIAGDCIASIFTAAKNGTFTKDATLRDPAAALADTAESAILIVGDRQSEATNLGADLRKADADGDKAFIDKGLKILGILTQPPLSFKPDRFIK